jgi:hypothetical protein
MKYENLAMEITSIWKLNNVFVYPLVISVEGMSGHQKIPEIYREYWFNPKHFKSGAKGSTCHTEREFLGPTP